MDETVKEIGDKIASLSLMQAKSLCDYLREVHGLEPAAAGVVVQNVAPKNVVPVEEVKATVDIHLVKVADTTKRMGVIKAVRELTGLGLVESKTLVDKAPAVVKAGVVREEAEKMKQTLEKEGATVEFK